MDGLLRAAPLQKKLLDMLAVKYVKIPTNARKLKLDYEEQFLRAVCVVWSV